MSSYLVREQCVRHNSGARCTAEYRRFPLERILSGEGNLLLTGGGLFRRREILLRLVRQLRRQYPEKPVFVFTGSADTERGLIEMARTGGLGPLCAVSPDYPNYSVFSGLPPAVIADCLVRLAENETLYGYALAFLTVLRRYQTESPSLADMLDFAKNSDAAIAAWAQEQDLPEQYSQLAGSPQCGKQFRSLLRRTAAAFSSLTPEEETDRFSFVNAVRLPCAVCLRVSTASPDLLAVYFSCVLQTLLGWGESFSVVLDEPALLQNPVFLRTLEELKRNPLVTAAVSVGNAAAFGEENFLGNFSRNIILTDGANPSDMQKILDSLGQYTHFEPAQSSAAPDSFFLWPKKRSVSDSILTYARPKILLEETEGFQAVLRGHRGTEIALIRRLEG